MPISVDPVSGLSADYFQTSDTQSVPGELDKNAFLNLLVTSLRYQDPSEPMSTNDLMAQTTQLATMEQLTAMTQLSQESFVLQVQTSAMNLVGRTVEYHDGEEMRTGVVTAVDFSASPPLIEVGGKIVTFGAVRAVVTAATPEPTEPDGTPEPTEPEGATESPSTS